MVSRDRATGDRVIGDRVTGDRVTGDRVTGERVSGDEPGVGSGDDVLDWLRSVDARRLARRRLRSAGLPASPDHVADVLGDATVSVWRRMRRPEPLVVDTPAAYGATVVRNHDHEGFCWTVLRDPAGNEFCVSDPHQPNEHPDSDDT